jgi:hypothetical protein
MFARIVGVALLVGCGVSIVGERGTGADEKPVPRKITLALDKWVVIQMANKQIMTKVATSEDGIVDVSAGSGGNSPRYFRFAPANEGERPWIVSVVPVAGPIGEGPRTVSIGARKIGKTVVTLTDENDKSERIEVEVRRELSLPIGISYSLLTPTAKPIAKITVDDAKIIKASKDAKGELVLIESLAVGETPLRVTDSAGKSESVVVQVRKPTLLLTEGEKKKIQMTKKQAVEVIANDNDRLLKVQPTDTTTVEIEAIGPGISNLVLIAQDKTEERFEVGVKPKGK